MEIEDPPLRNSVWNLNQAVKQKAAKKNRQQPPWPPKDPSDRNDWLLRNGTPEQAAESARIARERQGEKED